MIRTYSGMLLFESHAERLNYLKLLDNNVKSPRHMSQAFYKSKKWIMVREAIINRDLGFDLGVFGVYIHDQVIVHHIDPIDESDILYQTNKLTDPDNLITLSLKTHNIIHYGSKPTESYVERRPGDTKLW